MAYLLLLFSYLTEIISHEWGNALIYCSFVLIIKFKWNSDRFRLSEGQSYPAQHGKAGVNTQTKGQWILVIFFLRVLLLALMPHKVLLLEIPVALLLACFQILTCPKPCASSATWVWLCFNYYFSRGVLLETHLVFNVTFFSGNIDCF